MRRAAVVSVQFTEEETGPDQYRLLSSTSACAFRDLNQAISTGTSSSDAGQEVSSSKRPSEVKAMLNFSAAPFLGITINLLFSLSSFAEILTIVSVILPHTLEPNKESLFDLKSSPFFNLGEPTEPMIAIW